MVDEKIELAIGRMNETPARIEPLLFEDTIPRIVADLVSDIQSEAASLGRDLHNDTADELADLVRVMNCYYSNLIEGHNTKPKDIELALIGAEVEEKSRPLALEAKAHILVQRSIDKAYAAGTLPPPSSIQFLTGAHRAFYEEMPDEFKHVRLPNGDERPIVPGRFRTEPLSVSFGMR